MERYELDAFHDSVYNSIGKSLFDDELLGLIEKLPEDILSIGIQWGFNDTEFGDKVYEWIKTINV